MSGPLGDRIADVYDTARAYVRARLAYDDCETCDWSACIAEIDRTWHGLLEASGLSPETGDE